MHCATQYVIAVKLARKNKYFCSKNIWIYPIYNYNLNVVLI